MSHFAVAVITKGKPTEDQISKMLAPYQENNMGDCPREYMVFHSESKEYKDEYENGKDKRARLKDGRLVYCWDSCLYREISEFEYEKAKENGKNVTSEGFGDNKKYFVRDLEFANAEIVEVAWKELYKTFDEYMKDYHDSHYDEEMKDYGYWENPNAKWDWFEIGGRYAGHIKTLSNNSDVGVGTPSLLMRYNPYETENQDIQLVDSARIKDIIIHDEKAYQEKLRFWELYIEGQEPQNDKEKEMIKWVFYKKEYFIERYKTKENFAELESMLSTWAVITKDGKWYEPGTMGWFACSSASIEDESAFFENYKKFVFDSAEEDDYMTIVDCHI